MSTHSVNSSTRQSGRHLWLQRGAYRFAIPMIELVEVRKLDLLRPLPRHEAALAGFTVVRDQVIAVFDPLSLLGESNANCAHKPLAALMGNSSRLACAIVIDAVGQMIDLPGDAQPPADARVKTAFRAEHAMNDGAKLHVLDVNGLMQSMGLNHSSERAPMPNAA